MGVNKKAAGEPKPRWISGRRRVRGPLRGSRDPGVERRVSGKNLSFSERPAGPAPPVRPWAHRLVTWPLSPSVCAPDQCVEDDPNSSSAHFLGHRAGALCACLPHSSQHPYELSASIPHVADGDMEVQGCQLSYSRQRI